MLVYMVLHTCGTHSVTLFVTLFSLAERTIVRTPACQEYPSSTQTYPGGTRIHCCTGGWRVFSFSLLTRCAPRLSYPLNAGKLRMPVLVLRDLQRESVRPCGRKQQGQPDGTHRARGHAEGGVRGGANGRGGEASSFTSCRCTPPCALVRGRSAWCAARAFRLMLWKKTMYINTICIYSLPPKV